MFAEIKVLQRGNFKILKIFFGVLLVVCFAGPIILYYHHRASNVENHREDISDYRHPRPQHEIRGFRFDSNHDGKRVISIKADRFSVQKKKLGFFRFGLMNEAILENVFIHLYGRSGLAEDKSDDWQDLTFKDVFVSVPDIEVYSALPSEGAYDQKGTTIMDNRYIRHEYRR